MTTLERLDLYTAVDGVLSALLDKSTKRDPFAPTKQENQLRAVLYDRWDRQVEIARHAMAVAGGHFRATPDASLVGDYMQVLNAALSHDAITNGLPTKEVITSAFTIGQLSVDHMAKKAKVKKSNLMFGALFGLTEQHAMQALNDQLLIAAGSFWDDQLQASIQREMESWFTGTITREVLIDNLMTLVNTRLATEGKSLARSYFDNLSTHIINRSRNVGSYYRAKSLGAQQYKLYNPHDKRTSAICRAVTQGQVYEMAHAESTVTDLLQARTTADLKATVPFLTPATASGATGPVPPLHFGGCRTSMEYLFEGL